MAATSPDSRPNHNELDTTSIPHDAPENAGGIGGSRTWAALNGVEITCALVRNAVQYGR